MQVKQLNPTKQNATGRVGMRFTREELHALFGDSFRSVAGKYRVTIQCAEGTVTVRPTEKTGLGTYSIWPITSSEYPSATGVSPKLLEGVDRTGIREYTEMRTRIKGGANPAIVFQMPLLGDPTGAKPAAAKTAARPAPAKPQQELAEVSMPRAQPEQQREAPSVQHALVGMLENVYNVNPQDRAMLKSAMAVINDQIRRSKGAVQLHVTPQGELDITVAQFDVRMNQL